MKDIYLVNLSVKGIKSLDQLVSLSFYKKIILKNPDTQDYNIKGIYGMNGSGKSGIVTSVEILKNLLINPGYLNNPITQKNLDAIINKKTGELFIEADYMVDVDQRLILFRYSVVLSRDINGKYTVSFEKLSSKSATSKSETMNTIFEVSGGEVTFIYGKKEQDELSMLILNKTMNLLSTAPICALFYDKILYLLSDDYKEDVLWRSLWILYIFGKKLHVYLDSSDDHREFVARKSEERYDDYEKYKFDINSLTKNFVKMNRENIDVISGTGNIVLKMTYKYFERTVNQLYEFLHIFKSDLQGIEIDKKEDHDLWICDLIMVYETYRIHAEFESTGIKKLIRLFAYLKEMVQGGSYLLMNLIRISMTFIYVRCWNI